MRCEASEYRAPCTSIREECTYAFFFQYSSAVPV
jgi:hypothetical protein